MERRLRATLPGGEFKNVTEAHSARMGRIKYKGNKSTERRLRAQLVRAGVRGWVMHPDKLPGKPDLLFPELKLVVFADGCYWHGCPACGHIPNVNRPYWSAKIQGNKDRDVRNVAALVSQGYRVLRVWEHELKQGSAWLARLREMLAAT
jgi:DNA mismatch endonuclease (patch repair protein)